MIQQDQREAQGIHRGRDPSLEPQSCVERMLMKVTSQELLTLEVVAAGGGEHFQAVPPVGNRALLVTQVLEVLQAGRLMNYFPGVSLTGDRN